MDDNDDNGVLTLTVGAENEDEYLVRRKLRDLFSETLRSVVTPDIPDQDGYLGKLRLRDLIRLDPNNTSSEEKTVAVRRNAVIVSLDPVKAIVTHNKLVMLVPDGADSILQKIPQYINVERLDRSFQFDVAAYDAIFRTFFDLEREGFAQLASEIASALTMYRGKVALLPLQVQEDMKNHKNLLSHALQRVAAVKALLQALCEDDEELALMNLSLLQEKPLLYQFPIAQELLDANDVVEDIVQNHLIDFSTLESNLLTIQAQIVNAESAVSLRLDTSRNELYIANATLTLFAAATAIGGFLANLFGMNLDNTIGLQTVDGLFVTITITSFVTILLIILGGYAYMKITGILPERLVVSLKKLILLQPLHTRFVRRPRRKSR